MAFKQLLLNLFIKKYTGQHVADPNGGYVGECVSLAKTYALAHDNVPANVLYCSKTGGARDLYEQYDGLIPKYYSRIPFGKPAKRGDLIVWGADMGGYGHIAIIQKVLGSQQWLVFQQLGTPIFHTASLDTVSVKPLGYLRKK